MTLVYRRRRARALNSLLYGLLLGTCCLNSLVYAASSERDDVRLRPEARSHLRSATDMIPVDDQDILEAVNEGNITQVRSYLASHGDPNIVDHKGRNLLECAAGRGYIDIVKALLKAGALVDHEDQNKNTPLYMASSKGYQEIVNLLASKSRHLDQQDDRGVTALYIASKNGHTDVVEALQSAGANLDLTTHTGETALWTASYKGHTRTVDLLVRSGACIDLADEHDITPLLISCHSGHIDVVNLLLNGGADVNHVSRSGISSLISASYQGHEEIVRLLILGRADPSYKSPAALGGGTAYHYALQQDHEGIVAYLHMVLLEETAREHQREKERLEREKELLAAEASTRVSSGASENSRLWAAVIEEQRQKEHLEREKQYLRSDLSLRRFYERTERKLGQYFLGYKVLDTGIIQGTGGKFKKIGKGINLLGNAITFPFASLVTSALTTGLDYMDDRLQERHVQFITRLIVDVTTLDREVEQAARSLSYCYEEQIKELTEKGSEVLADCGVSRLIGSVEKKQIGEDLDLSRQLVCSVSVYKTYQGFLGMTHKTISTKTSKTPLWTDKGIFQETGIRVEGVGCFAGIDSRPGMYGFRKGSESEVRELDYREISY